MLIIGLFSWWYGDGWRQRGVMAKNRLASLLDTFSITLLIKTLFAPFRQIDAGKAEGTLSIKIQAFISKLISRFIGAFMRIIVIFVGILALIVSLIINGATLILWPLVPILPVVGLILTLSGWAP